MNVRTFEIHDVAVATSKFEVATAKTLKFELSNIHNLLRVVRFCCREFSQVCKHDLLVINMRGATKRRTRKSIMSLCCLTKLPLIFKENQSVADPYGHLYHKEAVVEALPR